MIKHATGRHYYTVLYTSSNHSTSLVEVSDVASCCSQPLIIDLWGTPMEKMWTATWGYTTFRPSPVFNSGLMLWTQFSLAGHLAVVGAHELYSTTCAPGGKCRAWTPKTSKNHVPRCFAWSLFPNIEVPHIYGHPKRFRSRNQSFLWGMLEGEVLHVFCIFLAEPNGSKWRILRFLCSGPGDPTAARLRPRELRRAIRSCVNTWRSLRNRLVIQFHGIVMGFYCILLPYNLLRVVGKNQ